MKVPAIDLKEQYKTYKDEVLENISKISENQAFIGGEFLEKFEQKLAAYSKCKFAIGCSSGSDAIILALLAIGIKPGDEIITTPFTFFATAGAPTLIGAVVKFVDIEEDTFNIDPDKLEKAISKKTKAIIAVDLFGQCADMTAINEIAKRHKLPVIEDSAQSLGAEHNGIRVGGLADITTTSFYPTKNIGAFGDAGALLTNNADYASAIIRLREHGASREKRYFHELVGMNARLDAIQAAVLNTKLGFLDNWIKKRQEHAALYNLLISKNGLGPIKIPRIASYTSRHVFNQYTIRTGDRDNLKKFLQEKEIGSSVFYPLGLHMQKCFENLGYKEKDFPVTEKACREVLSLPMFPELKKEQIEYVVDTMAVFFRR
jgi:dTDP-4-amino-4,6-dideoxygalactose transaminase